MDVGDVVDDFELPDETGTPRKLSDLLARRPGGAVLLPGGDDARVHEGELPLPRSAAPSSRRPVGSGSGISRDTVEKQHEFSDKHAFDYPLLADPDGEVARMMGVARKGGRPKRVTFVIGQDRRVVEVIKSEIRMNVHADRALDAHARG